MYKTKYAKYLTSAGKSLAVGLMLLSAQTLFAQTEKTLEGKVVDQKGNPIAGAVINIAEESGIAVSDRNGKFKLKKVKPGDELNIESVGYKNATIAPDFNGEFKVALEEDNDIYSKEIAVPFNRIQKKFNVTSSSTVSGEELIKHPVTVLQNALVGSVTGVETYEARSEPGWSETDLYIRGLRTMNGNARTPLIIVDNMERDLSFLDAFPIETITILKDAAATAIYGMRGANGVVLVTTKRGKAGKTRINLTQEFGYQTLSGVPETQNSYNYAYTVNQARYLDGLQPMYTDEDLQHYKEVCDGTLDPSLRYKYFNTNWHKELLRDAAPQNRTNLTISGGNNTTQYYVSFSRLHQEGMYDTRWTDWNSTKYKLYPSLYQNSGSSEIDNGYSTQHVLDRYNLRSNIDINVTDYLNVSLDLGGRLDNISQPAANTWTLFTWGSGELLPTNPVFCPNGEFFVPSDNAEKNGPAQLAMSGLDKNRRRNLYSNLTVTGKLDKVTPGLSVKATVGFDSYTTFQSIQTQNWDGFFYDFNSGTAEDPLSYTYVRKRTEAALSNPSAIARSMYYNINTIGSLNYDRTFGKHAISAQAMMRTYQNVVTGYSSSNRFLTYGAMANYIFDGKYILQGTAAYQGCDNYIKGDRYGFFPGVSAGWLLSEENWLKSKNISLLKLRASMGRSGQSATGVRRYPYQGEYAEGGGYNFGTSQSAQQGAYESSAGNQNIKWEISDMANVGVDFDFWNHKLYGQIDAFKEWRSNILVSRSTVPDMYGIAVPQDSYGKAETIGTEITLGHKGNIGKFNYFAEGMLTYNTNKITEMDEIEPNEPYKRRTGNRIDQRQVYILNKWASDKSLIPSTLEDAIAHPDKYPFQGNMKLGNAVFIDQNGDRQITADDQVPYGYSASIPELVPSVKVGFEYKGFDGRVMMSAFLNRTVECRENMDYAGGWGGTSTHEVTKTWGYYTDDPTDSRNINAKYPRLSTTYSDNDRNYPRNTSNIFIQNGNFLSLRNIEIGYSLPKKILAKANLTTCRLYFSGYNLYNWSHFDNGFDPESPLNYIWAYPKTKSFSFGLNVGF